MVLEKPSTSRGIAYGAQRAYVGAMLRVIAGLLSAASRVDPVVQRELAGFPEGSTIGMSVLGDASRMRFRVRGGRFLRIDSPTAEHADLEIVFKHVGHAFLVLSFQESTARAFANDRAILHGDVALAMRFVRCLDRVQVIALPKLVAARVLKRYPTVPIGEKLALRVRMYSGFVRDVFVRSPE